MAKNKSIFVEEDNVEDVAVEQTKQTSELVQSLSSTHNIMNLPSNGKLGYDVSVKYRDVMVADEEVLASASADTYAMTLNGVIKDVLDNPSWYGDMTTADRDFAVIWVWANNYGKIKEVEVKCSHCGNVDTHKVDLTKLPIIDLKENFKRDFEIPIEKTGKSVKVNLITVDNELEVEAYMKKHPDSDYAYLMAVASIDLGMHLPFEKRLDWVRKFMSGREFGFVKQYHNYFSYGVSPKLEHTCKKCGGVTLGKIPFHVKDILHPSASQEDFERLL